MAGIEIRLTLPLQSKNTCRQQGLSIFGSAAERMETLLRICQLDVTRHRGTEA